MSTFSSVVNKSGKKFAPKATARRNAPSRAPFSSPPVVLDAPAPARPLPSSLQDDANSSDASQSHGGAEQYTAAAAPAIHVPQSDGNTGSLNKVPTETDLKKSGSRSAEWPTLSRQAEGDGMRESGAAVQEKVHKEREATRKPQTKPAVVKNGEIAHQQPAQGNTSQEESRKPDQQAPDPQSSARTTRSQNAGMKRKSNFSGSDSSDVAPGFNAAISAPEKEAPTKDLGPRKRRKAVLKEPGLASVAALTPGSTVSGGGTTEMPAIADVPVAQADVPDIRGSRPARKKRAKKTMQEVATGIVADAVGDTSEANEGSTEGMKKRRRKWKRKIPEGAEDHEIVPQEVKMADLVKDKRLGKGSKLEARLEQIDWDEVKKKRKQAEEEAEKQRELDREEKRTGRPVRQGDVPAASTVPKLTLRDGQVVMEEESRMVDRHAEIEQAADEAVNELDVDDVTRRVNQSTIGRQSGVKQKGHWNDEMTDLFYKGLRMFGTDFMMISKMFPGLSRRHIKLKYTREERTNLARVHHNLVTKEDVDMEEYSQMSNQVYEDPRRVQEEIAADEKKLRDEDFARRAREAEADQGDVAPEDSNVLQSREQGTAEPSGGDEAETTAPETESSAKENRFESVARGIVQRAAAPKKPKKQNALTRKRDRKKKTGLEGTEEVVGSIEDVQRG